MNKQPERLAFDAKVDAIAARWGAIEPKLDAIYAKRDVARQIWLQAEAEYQAEITDYRAEAHVIQAELKALDEEKKRLPRKPLDVATIDPAATSGREGQN